MEKSPKTDKSTLLDKYITSLSEKDHKGYMIAKSHLGSSFSLEKSIGYIEWVKNQSD
jgi:hypothetical protein